MGLGHDIGKGIGLARDLTTAEIIEQLQKTRGSIERLVPFLAKVRFPPSRDVVDENQVEALQCVHSALHHISIIANNTPQEFKKK